MSARIFVHPAAARDPGIFMLSTLLEDRGITDIAIIQFDEKRLELMRRTPMDGVYQRFDGRLHYKQTSTLLTPA